MHGETLKDNTARFASCWFITYIIDLWCTETQI